MYASTIRNLLGGWGEVSLSVTNVTNVTLQISAVSCDFWRHLLDAEKISDSGNLQTRIDYFESVTGCMILFCVKS